MEGAIVAVIEQAPAVGALVWMVFVFLRHIDKSDTANREVMRGITEALLELRNELREERRR